MLILVVILSLLMNIHGNSAACVFPTDLVGMWSSSDGGRLVITMDEVNDYRINLTVMLTAISFKCHDLYQDKYILKSSSTFFFNTFEFDAYLCVEFYKISNTKFTYQLVSVVDPSINERVVTKFAGNIPVLADICNRPAPFEEETLITLNKIETKDSQIEVFETAVPVGRTTGPNVQLHLEANTQKGPDEYAPLIGGVVGGVLVIGALAVIATFCYCRQKSPLKSKPSSYMINFTSSVLQKEHTEPSNMDEETKRVQ